MRNVFKEEQMCVIRLNLLYRLHVARTDTRHDYLTYGATVQRASQDLSTATEEQRQRIQVWQKRRPKIATNWHKERKMACSSFYMKKTVCSVSECESFGTCKM